MRQARKFDNTNIIERAAAAAFGPFDGHQGKAVRRSLSGAAHGLAWPMLGRVGTQQTSAADWELLDLRGAAPA